MKQPCRFLSNNFADVNYLIRTLLKPNLMKTFQFNVLSVFAMLLFTFSLSAQTGPSCDPSNCQPKDCKLVCKPSCCATVAEACTAKWSPNALLEKGQTQKEGPSCQKATVAKCQAKATAEVKEPKAVTVKYAAGAKKTSKCQVPSCSKPKSSTL